MPGDAGLWPRGSLLTDVTLAIEGVDGAVSDLDKALRTIERAEVGAYIEAAQIVHRRSDETIPIDTGNLAASGGTRVARDDPRAAEIYYDAQYAAPVHENVDATFSRPGARAKFLELALREKLQDVVRHVARRVGKAAGG